MRVVEDSYGGVTPPTETMTQNKVEENILFVVASSRKPPQQHTKTKQKTKNSGVVSLCKLCLTSKSKQRTLITHQILSLILSLKGLKEGSCNINKQNV